MPSIKIIRHPNVRQVNGVRVGDEVWIDDERYTIQRFIGRKKAYVKQNAGIKTKEILTKDMDPVL